MSSPPKPPIPKAAEPKYGQTFDPWNSSSSGHQRAENRLGDSTGWRDSRNKKLMSQFKGGASGGQRVSDTVGAGSKYWDPNAKALIPPELRSRAQSSVMDMLANPGTMKPTLSSTADSRRANPDESERHSALTAEERLMAQRRVEDEARVAEKERPRGMFDGVVVYVNGSTHPLISDHKLKHVLAEHGAKMSSHLGRRKVTHIILGRPAGGKGGAGGGLAGGKLQKEIQKVGGCGVKFVGVEWVLESIKAGKRLPEAGFSDLKIASRGQQSVHGLYSKQKASVTDNSGPPPSGQA
ncbi:Uu.00g102470.m01.CDS01 [Anthostomella pinea]|uniref:Uu.00g102470.m01.CDS01 n=1 Tax=Anthostomella pinea TaxID=933095 RepID=A0AAI8VDW6_9PEZI|nr:Uu.00g102470.m01.CDS01 [Anthostomella pinea]